MSLAELRSIGLEEMDEEAIRNFLTSQGTGVLGLPAEGPPYMLPMSFGYDGSSLYFTFVLGADSRKEAMAEAAEVASFLVYQIDTVFQWQSVTVTGPIREVSEAKWEGLADLMETAWRPALFEDAELSRGVAVYELVVEEQSGVRHTGLPPGFAPGEGD